MKKLSTAIIGLSLLPCFAFGAIYNQTAQHQQQSTDQITPAVGPIGNRSVDVTIDAQFLWWYSTITNMPYVIVREAIPQGNALNPQNVTTVTKRMKEFDREWDPGCRLGLGLIFDHDGWDLSSDWTYFYNSGHDSKTVAPFASLGTTPNQLPNNAAPGTQALATPWGSDGGENLYSHVSGHWSVLFHQIDLELGRKFWISKRLTTRPYGGLRGYWSRLYMRSRGVYGENPSTVITQGDTTFQEDTNNMKQKMWAVGLLAGIDTAWHMTRNWSLFGEAATALVYGCWDIKERRRLHIQDGDGADDFNLSHTYRHDDIYGFVPVIDLAIGLRWESTFGHCDQFRMLFDAGWENHIWIDFNKLDRPIMDDPQQQNYISSDGNLSLSGIRIRARFEF